MWGLRAREKRAVKVGVSMLQAETCLVSNGLGEWEWDGLVIVIVLGNDFVSVEDLGV